MIIIIIKIMCIIISHKQVHKLFKRATDKNVSNLFFILIEHIDKVLLIKKKNKPIFKI